MLAKILLLVILIGSSSAQGYEKQLNEELSDVTPAEFIKIYGDYGMIEHRWTENEINHLALTAQTEAYGLGEDAMLSVIGTVYARWRSPIWCSASYCSQNMVEEVRRPRQFDGPYFAEELYGKDVYDIIKPNAFLAVYKFILGFRGSCSGINDFGYEYFNSIPGGNSECKIMGNGQFIEFFSSEKFKRAQADELYRNIRSTSTGNSGPCFNERRFRVANLCAK